MTLFYRFLHLIGITTHRVFRLTLRGFVLLVGSSAAFVVSVLLHMAQFYYASMIFFVVLTCAFFEFVLADVLAERSFPFDTQRKIDLLERRMGATVIKTIATRLREVISSFRACDPSLISATVHILVGLDGPADERGADGLLQLTDYVGPGGGAKGRITLIHQGIIGRCARAREMETVNFASEDEYLDSMVRYFGFTSKEAERHSKTGRSYLAYPLHLESSIVGVLYFFSSEPQVFPMVAAAGRLEGLAREIVNYMRFAGLV